MVRHRIGLAFLITLGIAQWCAFSVVLVIGARAFFEQREHSLLHFKETVLRQDLFVMREAIDQFTMDKKAAPQSLDDIRTAGYIREIPRDPFTHSANWTTDTCDTLSIPDQTATGICDVHSIAPGSSPFEGTPYITW